MPTHSIHEFELWQPGYGGKTVYVYIEGTTSLASLYTDEALTVAASNPQALSENNANAGKFAAPLYTSSAYHLEIEGEETGVERPALITLVAADSSYATARAARYHGSGCLCDRPRGFS